MGKFCFCLGVSHSRERALNDLLEEHWEASRGTPLPKGSVPRGKNEESSYYLKNPGPCRRSPRRRGLANLELMAGGPAVEEEPYWETPDVSPRSTRSPRSPHSGYSEHSPVHSPRRGHDFLGPEELDSPSPRRPNGSWHQYDRDWPENSPRKRKRLNNPFARPSSGRSLEEESDASVANSWRGPYELAGGGGKNSLSELEVVFSANAHSPHKKRRRCPQDAPVSDLDALLRGGGPQNDYVVPVSHLRDKSFSHERLTGGNPARNMAPRQRRFQALPSDDEDDAPQNPNKALQYPKIFFPTSTRPDPSPDPPERPEVEKIPSSDEFPLASGNNRRLTGPQATAPLLPPKPELVGNDSYESDSFMPHTAESTVVINEAAEELDERELEEMPEFPKNSNTNKQFLVPNTMGPKAVSVGSGSSVEDAQTVIDVFNPYKHYNGAESSSDAAEVEDAEEEKDEESLEPPPFDGATEIDMDNEIRTQVESELGTDINAQVESELGTIGSIGQLSSQILGILNSVGVGTSRRREAVVDGPDHLRKPSSFAGIAREDSPRSRQKKRRSTSARRGRPKDPGRGPVVTKDLKTIPDGSEPETSEAVSDFSSRVEREFGVAPLLVHSMDEEKEGAVRIVEAPPPSPARELERRHNSQYQIMEEQLTSVRREHERQKSMGGGGKRVPTMLIEPVMSSRGSEDTEIRYNDSDTDAAEEESSESIMPPQPPPELLSKGDQPEQKHHEFFENKDNASDDSSIPEEIQPPPLTDVKSPPPKRAKSPPKTQAIDISPNKAEKRAFSFDAGDSPRHRPRFLNPYSAPADAPAQKDGSPPTIEQSLLQMKAFQPTPSRHFYNPETLYELIGVAPPGRNFSRTTVDTNAVLSTKRDRWAPTPPPEHVQPERTTPDESGEATVTSAGEPEDNTAEDSSHEFQNIGQPGDWDFHKAAESLSDEGTVLMHENAERPPLKIQNPSINASPRRMPKVIVPDAEAVDGTTSGGGGLHSPKKLNKSGLHSPNKRTKQLGEVGERSNQLGELGEDEGTGTYTPEQKPSTTVTPPHPATTSGGSPRKTPASTPGEAKPEPFIADENFWPAHLTGLGHREVQESWPGMPT